MKYYIVTDDLQGGEFGMFRAYTAQGWSEQAQEWCDYDSEDDEVLESWDLSNYDTEQDLIDDIADFWEIRFAQIDEEQKKVYDELVEKCGYGYSARVKDTEEYWKFIDTLTEVK